MAALKAGQAQVTTESLLPANMSDVAALKAGQAQVTTALAAFGVGGLFGDLGLGIIMTFGPFARRHFLIFVLNDLVMFAVSGEMGNVCVCVNRIVWKNLRML